jgi:hypothetical protein
VFYQAAWLGGFLLRDILNVTTLSNNSAGVFNIAVEKFVEKPGLTLVTFCQRVASTVCTVGGANGIAANRILSDSRA